MDLGEIAKKIRARAEKEPPSRVTRVLHEFEEVLLYARKEKNLSYAKIAAIVNEELKKQGRKGVAYTSVYGFIKNRIKKQQGDKK